MKQHSFKPVLAALLLAGSCAAQAAHFEVVDSMAFAGYSLADGTDVSGDVIDASQGGDVSIFGVYQSPDASHGYSADATLFSGNNFRMSTTQYVDAGITNSANLTLAVPQITLKIVGDGEAIGATVRVNFSGLAESVNSFAGASGMLTMDMAVTSGSTTLGSYLWDASAETNAQQNISFNFLSKVGDTVALSGFMSSSLMADGAQTNLASAAGSLSGDFTIAAVPEPEQYAMLLAGLGVLAAAARRRTAR